MSAHNPYYDDDIDADLFDENDSNKHVLDGSICPSCGVSHDPSAIGGEGIASALLDSLPPDLANSFAQSLPSKNRFDGASELARILYGVVSELDSYRPESPTLDALVHVLDSITDGKVTKLTELFAIEKTIVSTTYINHRVVQLIEMFHERRNDSKDNEENSISMHLSSMWIEYLEERIRILSERYFALGEQIDIDIDTQLIHEGIASIDRTKKLVDFFKFHELDFGIAQ